MERGRLWVVTPVYLDVEAFQLLRKHVIEVAHAHPDLQSKSTTFVVLDDTAGDDPEIATLTQLHDVRVIVAPFNLGHQRGIVHALRVIAPELGDDDIVVTLDADGEDRPEDIPRLVAPLLADPARRSLIVLARRTGRRTSLSFKILYVFFTMLFRILTGTSVRTGNFAAYRGWEGKRMLRHPYFDLCYSATLLSLQMPIEFVPCERGSRYAGKTRMGFSKLFMHGLRMLMPFIDRIAVRALLLFSITFAVGLGASLVVIGIRTFTQTAIPGWATYTLIGVIILSLVALGSFVTLFAVFSQSRAISLTNIDPGSDGPTRSTPSKTD